MAWRRLLWWTSDRPAALPWAILLSLALLLAGHSIRQSIASTAVEYVYAPFFAMKHRIGASARVFDENRELQRRIVEISLDNQRLAEAGIENRNLRALLDLSPPWRVDAVPAEVVAPMAPGSGDMWIQTGKGSEVETGWPVTTEDGLVGKIVEQDGPLSHVRTLWDQLSRVAAHDQRSRAAGIVAWESGPNLMFSFVPLSADVQVGDSIVSSGWGGVFPKGLRIGTVTTVDTIPDAEFLSVGIAPSVRVDLLEQVFVIRPELEDTNASPGEVQP